MRVSPFLVLLAACGGSAAAPTGGVHLAVIALSGAPLAGARIVAVDPDSGAALSPAVRTDASGRAQLAVRPGRIAVRAFAGGFVSYPPPGLLATPIVGVEGGSVTTTVWLAARGSQGVAISGTVRNNRGPVPGALVWATASGVAVAGLSDTNGAFEVLGVPAGPVQIRAVITGGGMAEPRSVTAPATGVSLVLDNSTRTAAGTIQYQASDRPGVDVGLAEPATGELVPGLLTRSSAGIFQLGHVPDGTYFVVATPGSDGVVAAPGPPVTMEVGASSTQPTVPVTDAVELVQPAALGDSLAAADASATPVLQWHDYHGADAYAPEVLDGAGATLWGGIDADGKPRFSTTAAEPFATYGEGGGAPALVPGRLYRARVWALRNGAVLSTSEPTRGYFMVTQ